MRIISWNVNGIRAVHKKDLFLPFITEYEPDILCLQETKAQQHESPVDLLGYDEYWNSAARKGYSGTAICTKTTPLSIINDLPHDIAKKYELEGDGYGDPNAEGRVIACEFEKFYIVTVYTPNAKDDLSRLNLRHKHWDPAFLEYITRLEETKPVIFCGDLNVAHMSDDLARPKDNVGNKGFTVEERQGIDAMIGAGYIDSFRMFTEGNGHYTWWSHFAAARARNVGWRIDYIFVSEKLRASVSSARILPDVLGSDHCPVLLDINI